MKMTDILYLLIGVLIGMSFSVYSCGKRKVSDTVIGSLKTVINDKSFENVELKDKAVKLKEEKQNIRKAEYGQILQYRALSRSDKVGRISTIKGVTAVNDSVVQLDIDAIDSINLLRIDNQFTHVQLSVSDSIVRVQDSIIVNDSIIIKSHEQIEVKQSETIKADAKEIKRLKFQRTALICLIPIVVLLGL